MGSGGELLSEILHLSGVQRTLRRLPERLNRKVPGMADLREIGLLYDKAGIQYSLSMYCKWKEGVTKLKAFIIAMKSDNLICSVSVNPDRFLKRKRFLDVII